MNSPVQPQTEITNTQTTKKRGTRIILVLVLLVLCITFTSGIGLGYMVGINQKVVIPTVTPTVSPTPTTVVTVTTTPTTSPTNPPDDLYKGWVQYILADCNIKLLAPPDWTPGKRGEDGTCGSFRLPVDNQASGFSDYQGLLVVFTKFSIESKYAFTEREGIDKYLERIPREADDFRENKDFLVKMQPSTVAGVDATYAEIKRAGLGDTKNMFYKLFGTEYAIIWGGSNSESLTFVVETMLKSIQSVQPVD